MDLTRERARLARAQADKTELELAKLRGELVEIEVAAKTIGEEYAVVRAKLLGLPTRAAPLVHACNSVPEVNGILSDLVYEALAELSADCGDDTEAEEAEEQR